MTLILFTNKLLGIDNNPVQPLKVLWKVVTLVLVSNKSGGIVVNDVQP